MEARRQNRRAVILDQKLSHEGNDVQDDRFVYRLESIQVVGEISQDSCCQSLCKVVSRSTGLVAFSSQQLTLLIGKKVVSKMILKTIIYAHVLTHP